MTQLIHWISRSIILATAMLLATINTAYAQEVVAQEVVAQEVVAQEVVDLPDFLQGSADSEVEPSVPSVPSDNSPGFWIIRSDASPQDFETTAPTFCPTVTRYEPCAGFRSADMVELTQAIKPGVPVCIYCHGSFVSWEDVLNESWQTWKWLHKACPNQSIQMIYFSWPSDRPFFTPVIQLDVNRLGRRAGRNGFYMASLVNRIPSECPICLLGHSHGTRVITSSLHLMNGGAVEDYVFTPGPYPQHRLRAVFAASAMDHNWMNPGQRYDRALCSVEGILNLRNSCDPALFIYPLRRPFSGGALGYTGVTNRDRQKLGYCGQKIQDLDLSEEIGARHYWPNYFRQDWLAGAIRQYLFFGESTETE